MEKYFRKILFWGGIFLFNQNPDVRKEQRCLPFSAFHRSLCKDIVIVVIALKMQRN